MPARRFAGNYVALSGAAAAAVTLQSICDVYAFTAAASNLKQNTAGTTAVAADGDPVARWNDLSAHALNMTNGGVSTTRPLYHVASGKEWVETDGADDLLASGALAVAQPWARVSAIRPASNGGARVFWDRQRGAAGNLGHLQVPNVTGFRLLDGSASSVVGDSILPTNTDFIVFEGHLAEGSKYIEVYNKAGALLASGSGLSAGTNAGDGIAIGPSSTGAVPMACRFYGVGAKSSDFTAGEKTALISIMQGLLP